jgi:hypothetical protein
VILGGRTRLREATNGRGGYERKTLAGPAHALLLTFQTLNVLMGWMAHESRSAFGEFPTGFPIAYSQGEVTGCGVVNLVIVLAGVGLLLLGGRVRSSRDAKQNAVTVGS